MSIEKLKFKTCQLVVKDDNKQDRCLDYEDCTNITNSQSVVNKIFSNNELLYDLYAITTLEKLWVYGNYGNPNPCPVKLYDEKIGKYLNNHRTENQTELRNQVFYLYDFKTKILYTSNKNKNIGITTLLNETIKLNVFTKNVYCNIETFKEKLKKLDSLKFSSYDSIFTRNSKLQEGFKDLLGSDSPIDFELIINYNGLSLQNDARHVLTNIYNKITSKEVRNLVIQGRNDEGLETVFNSDALMDTVEINVSKDNKKGFSHEEVLSQLLNRIN